MTVAIAFPSFGRFAAILVNDVCHGFMEHRAGETKLHLGTGAPVFLAKVNNLGSFESHDSCQVAIRLAATGVTYHRRCPTCRKPVTHLFDHLDGCPEDDE